MKKLLISALALAAFVGCSKDSDQAGVPAVDMKGKAFLSIGMVNAGAGTRANTQTPGSEQESKASKVTVLLFDEMNLCLGAVDFSGATVGNSNGAGNAAAASDAKPVPAATKKVFVVINNFDQGWDLSDATVKGKSWSAVNTAVTNAVIGSIAADDSFVMTSAGTLEKGALTDVTVQKPASESQADIDAAKAAAKAAPAEIFVDRMASKVSVATNASGVQAPDGVTFVFQNWDLSVTNKSVKLYSDIIPYTLASTSAVKGIYRKDNNFTVAEQPVGETAMKAAFNYLTNEPLSNVALASGAAAYCLENTMDAPAQKLGVTTKAVVKAKYTPKGITAGESYFMWNGEFYTLTSLKAAYASHSAGTGLKADLPVFLKKAGLMVDGDDADTKVAALTDASFSATSGITGRYCAVRYYHQSVCYYDVLVFHDQSVTTPMGLGRYGVVRNNWYSLSIDKVSNPGTPWIPDPSDPDPSNPTVPDTDDDMGNAYLSVQITINPWTFWTQGVELN